jgi:hypothetical protein
LATFFQAFSALAIIISIVRSSLSDEDIPELLPQVSHFLPQRNARNATILRGLLPKLILVLDAIAIVQEVDVQIVQASALLVGQVPDGEFLVLRHTVEMAGIGPYSLDVAIAYVIAYLQMFGQYTEHQGFLV